MSAKLRFLLSAKIKIFIEECIVYNWKNVNKRCLVYDWINTYSLYFYNWNIGIIEICIVYD